MFLLFGVDIFRYLPAIADSCIDQALDSGADWRVTDREDFFDWLPRAGGLPFSVLDDLLSGLGSEVVGDTSQDSEAFGISALTCFGAQRDVIAEHLDREGALPFNGQIAEPVMRGLGWSGAKLEEGWCCGGDLVWGEGFLGDLRDYGAVAGAGVNASG